MNRAWSPSTICTAASAPSPALKIPRLLSGIASRVSSAICSLLCVELGTGKLNPGVNEAILVHPPEPLAEHEALQGAPDQGVRHDLGHRLRILRLDAEGV